MIEGEDVRGGIIHIHVLVSSVNVTVVDIRLVHVEIIHDRVVNVWKCLGEIVDANFFLHLQGQPCTGTPRHTVRALVMRYRIDLLKAPGCRRSITVVRHLEIAAHTSVSGIDTFKASERYIASDDPTFSAMSFLAMSKILPAWSFAVCTASGSCWNGGGSITEPSI